MEGTETAATVETVRDSWGWAPPDRYGEVVSFARRYLWIRDKRARLRPLAPNTFQQRYLEEKSRALDGGKPARFAVLKSRRGGITTWEQADSYHRVTTEQNQRVATLAHDLDSTVEIFDVARTYYRNAVGEARPPAGKSNRRELTFHDGRSKFFVGTAGGEGFGRGFTLSKVHGSEVAKWPGSIEDQRDLLVGLTEACSHGEVVLESTANGTGNLYYEICDEARLGEGLWTLIFLPWPYDQDCRLSVTREERDEIESTLSDEEKALIARFDLLPDQIAWRRNKKLELKRLFPQEYPENPVDCFLRSGHCFFDLDRLLSLTMRCRPPVDSRMGGRLTVWHPPEEGKTYIMGLDSSDGLPDSDPCAAGILELESGKQCARLWGRWRPYELGRIAVKLAVAYNYAFIVPEINNHGHSTVNTILIQEEYPSNEVYHRLKFDDGSVKATKIAGWETSVKTRPLLLDTIAEVVDAGDLEINDDELLAEMRTFCLSRKGKYEAEEGKHDDLVIAWALAYFVRQTERIIRPTKSPSDKPEDVQA
jgi:hypothetical protein